MNMDTQVRLSPIHLLTITFRLSQSFPTPRCSTAPSHVRPSAPHPELCPNDHPWELVGHHEGSRVLIMSRVLIWEDNGCLLWPYSEVFLICILLSLPLLRSRNWLWLYCFFAEYRQRHRIWKPDRRDWRVSQPRSGKYHFPEILRH